jgi:hypothetical protein
MDNTYALRKTIPRGVGGVPTDKATDSRSRIWLQGYFAHKKKPNLLGTP